MQNKVLLIRHWGQWWKLQRIFFRLKANYPLWSRNSQWRKICFHFLCMYFVVWLWIKWFQLNEISDYYPHLCHKSFMAIFLVKQQHVSNLLDNLYQSPNGKYNSYFQFVFNVVEFQNMISEKGQSSTIKVEWIIWICKCCLHLQRKLPLAKVSEWTVSALTKGNREGIVVPISEYKNPILPPLLS